VSFILNLKLNPIGEQKPEGVRLPFGFNPGLEHSRLIARTQGLVARRRVVADPLGCLKMAGDFYHVPLAKAKGRSVSGSKLNAERPVDE
jgi:hypothetical protein